MNQPYDFCWATEAVPSLESIYGNLYQIGMELQLFVITVRSVLMPTFRPVLAIAEKIIPDTDGLRKSALLGDRRNAFDSCPSIAYEKVGDPKGGKCLLLLP